MQCVKDTHTEEHTLAQLTPPALAFLGVYRVHLPFINASRVCRPLPSPIHIDASKASRRGSCLFVSPGGKCGDLLLSCWRLTL